MATDDNTGTSSTMPERKIFVTRPVATRDGNITRPVVTREVRRVSDSEETESTTSYCSTCTQTTYSTNVIDNDNRVIHRRVVSNPRVIRVVNKPPVQRVIRRERVQTVKEDPKQYLIKKHLRDSQKYISKMDYTENINQVKKPGRRPGSASSVPVHRVIRTRRNSEDDNIRGHVIVRRPVSHKAESDHGYVERRIIRRVIENPEPHPVVIRQSREPTRVIRRVIRSRPSSYDSRIVRENVVLRPVRPSSYHAGMANEYEPVPPSDEASSSEEETRRVVKEIKVQNSNTRAVKQFEGDRWVDEHDEPEKVVKEYRLQDNDTRAVKQLEGDRWVDEYDVPDKEVRSVGVQMTTVYKAPKPPEKKIRTVGTQTKQKKEKPPPPPPPKPRTPTPPPPPKIKTPEPEPKRVFQLPPPLPVVYRPKCKHQYVRVGGGWMKIDHYRNHHVPLKIYENKRGFANNRFLSVKYRYTKDKKKTPVAWSKYRSRVAHDA